MSHKREFQDFIHEEPLKFKSHDGKVSKFIYEIKFQVRARCEINRDEIPEKLMEEREKMINSIKKAIREVMDE